MTGRNNGYPPLYNFVNRKELPKKKPQVKKGSKFPFSEIALLDLTGMDCIEKATNEEFDFHRFAEANQLFGNIAAAVNSELAVAALIKGKGRGKGRQKAKGKKAAASSSSSDQNEVWWFDAKANEQTIP
jgi:hypothetical protein